MSAVRLGISRADLVLLDAVYGRGPRGKRRSCRRSCRFWLARGRFYRDEAIYWASRALDATWPQFLRDGFAQEAYDCAWKATSCLSLARDCRREAHSWR